MNLCCNCKCIQMVCSFPAHEEPKRCRGLAELMDDTEVRRCMRLVVSQSSKQRRRSEKKNQIEEKFASKSSLSVCDFRIGLKNMLKCERMN